MNKIVLPNRESFTRRNQTKLGFSMIHARTSLMFDNGIRSVEVKFETISHSPSHVTIFSHALMKHVNAMPMIAEANATQGKNPGCGPLTRQDTREGGNRNEQ